MSGDPSGPSSPPPAAGGRVGSAVGRAVAALALASTRRPLVTVVISLLLAAAGTLYTLHALTFVTSNLRLLPQKASYVVRLQDYQRDFGELNDIVVVVEAASPDAPRPMPRASSPSWSSRGSRGRGSPIGSTPRTSRAAACSMSPGTTSSSCATGSSTTRSSSRATRPARRCPSSSPGSTSRSPTRWPSGSSTSACGARAARRTFDSSSR